MSNRYRNSVFYHSMLLCFLLSLSAISASAQSTAFTYQGKLTDTGNLANASYDFQFALFDALSGGAQQGTTQTISNVTVTNGIFTVTLDFGACPTCFNGAARYLEIAVKLHSSGSYTTLTPRQPITATPYAMKTSNLTFNGAYNDGAGTVFTASNTFAGESAGVNTTPSGTLNSTNGKFSSFYGAGAGQQNTTGSQNSFFGAQSGQANTTGFNNAFFGFLAGFSNTTGNINAFFGSQAGQQNTTGGANSFFGIVAGQNNTTGAENAFFGSSAGSANTTGQRNTFIGSATNFSGANSTGNDNTLLGSASQVTANLNNATAVGAKASVTQSNSLILGSINGINNASADTLVGIGTTAPQARLNVNGTSWFQGDSTPLPPDAGNGIAVGYAFGADAGYIFAFDYNFRQSKTLALNSPGGRVGIGTLSPDQTLTVNGGASKSVGGTTWAVFSDERLKTIKGRFTPGLSALLQLQPIRYEYKADNALGLKSDGEAVGFSAQAVARVLPEAVSRTSSGYLQLNSDPILWTMLNAVKEQQVEIERLRQELRQAKEKQSQLAEQQQQEMAAMKHALCQLQPQAEFCQAKTGK